MARKLLTADAVRKRLADACGDDVAGWAARHGVTKAYVYMVLNGEREPGGKICDALGVSYGKAYWVKL